MALITTAAPNAYPIQDVYLAKVFLETLRKDFLLYALAMKDRIAERSGKTIRFLLWDNPVLTKTYATTTAKLAEGADAGTSQSLATTKYEDSVDEFGDWFEWTELFEKVATSGSVQAIVEAAGYQARGVVDINAHAVLQGGTPTTIDAGAALTIDALRQAAQKLAMEDVKPHPASPGGQFYVAVVSAEAGYDMIGEGNPAFWQIKGAPMEAHLRTPLEETPASAGVYNVLVKISNVISIASMRITAASPDDDSNFVFGKESFGAATLDESLAQPKIFYTPGSQRVDVKFRNRSYVSWHMYGKFLLFPQTRYVQVLSDATGVGV